MREFFLVANSKAAPFFSDTTERYMEANTASEALDLFVESYAHPAGLYAANVYENADAFHKGRRPLATFQSDKASV